MGNQVCPLCFEPTEKTNEIYVEAEGWSLCEVHQTAIDLGAVGLVCMCQRDRVPTGDYMLISHEALGVDEDVMLMQIAKPIYQEIYEELEHLHHDESSKHSDSLQ